MVWLTTDINNEKQSFIQDWLKKEFTFSELCHRYAISRKTGYKLINRFKLEGQAACVERPRVPHYLPHQTSDEITALLIQAKHRYPHWGPVTIRHKLKSSMPKINWPAASTIGAIYLRHNLVKPRKYRRKTPPYTQPFQNCDAPNRVWSADFKGQFKVGTGEYCYPLTVTDNYSRFLLSCHAMINLNEVQVIAYFKYLFKKYGLPDAIRTDNGAPFATTGIGGLSKLAILFLKLDIIPERIDVGCPEQNGRHERMHRTLKMATAKPAQATMSAQQTCFNNFIQEYNDERPHQGIGMRTPRELYHRSTREYPKKIPEVKYPDSYAVRKVRSNGEIRWSGKKYYLSELLRGEPIGLELIDEGRAFVYYSALKLGIIDARLNKIKRLA